MKRVTADHFVMDHDTKTILISLRKLQAKKKISTK